MIYIKKESPSVEIAQKIADVKRTPGWREATTSESIRSFFDLLDKSAIRKQLISEQHGLCAYCMRQIVDSGLSTKIEHFVPLSKNKEQALEYGNFLAVCDGGENSKNPNSPHDKKLLCCDSAKGNDEQLVLNPQKEDVMSKIVYENDGAVIRYSGNDSTAVQANHELNDMLRLNGVLDSDGKLLYDTASGVVKGRKDAYRNYVTRLKRLVKKGHLSSSAIQKEIDAMKAQEKYPEYIGVILFYLERKKKSLLSQGR